MQPRVSDVEQIKKQVRKLAAGKVLSGGQADVGLDLGPMAGCRASICGGYGALSQKPEAAPHDRLIWLLDGYAEIHEAGGRVTHISQGESTVLKGGCAYRLVFPQLTLYLKVEAVAEP